MISVDSSVKLHSGKGGLCVWVPVTAKNILYIHYDRKLLRIPVSILNDTVHVRRDVRTVSERLGNNSRQSRFILDFHFTPNHFYLVTCTCCQQQACQWEDDQLLSHADKTETRGICSLHVVVGLIWDDHLIQNEID